MTEWQEKRRANKIARIQEDRQITLDEAIEEYYRGFRERGSKGGKNGKGHEFAHGKLDPREAQEKSAEIRRSKRGK